MSDYRKIPIGIKSCEGYSERQNACRNTWIGSLDKDKYLPLFLVGRKDQPTEIIDDILYLDCNDGYDKVWELRSTSDATCFPVCPFGQLLNINYRHLSISL